MQNNKIIIGGLEINYTDIGEGDAVVILHGWAMSSFYWQDISEKLAKIGFRAIAVDLPGSGESGTPKEIWGNDEYVEFILNFLKKLEIDKFNLIGHSFGGALAIKIAANYPEKVKKAVLCDAAFVRGQRLNLRQKISKFVADIAPKSVKAVPFYPFLEKVVYKIAGVSDYYRASPIMREIFKKVVSEDMSNLAGKVKADCLIVWGEKDLATPLSDGIMLNDLIKGSRLKIISGVGHNPYRKKPKEFFEAVELFLKNN